MRSTVERYARLVEPGKRKRWGAVLALGMLVSLVEATGAGLVYLLIGLATGAQDAVELPVIGDVRRFLPEAARSELVALTAGVVALFFLIRALIVIVQRYVQTRVVQLAGVDLSTRLLERYLRLPYAFHLRRNSSTLIRNTRDAVAEA